MGTSNTLNVDTIVCMERVHTFDNDTLVSSKDASRLLNCSHDYVGRLCREGKIYGEKIGRTWYVSQNSLTEFKKEITQVKEERRQELSEIIKSNVLVHKNRNVLLTHTGVYFLFAVFAVWILFMLLWIPTSESTRDGLSGAWSYADTIVSALERRVFSVVDNTSKWFQNSAASFVALTGSEEEPTSEVKRGVVVSNDDQIDVVDVQNIFSDIVEINPAEDGVSGIITPVFKEVSEEDYVYVLVPLNEE